MKSTPKCILPHNIPKKFSGEGADPTFGVSAPGLPPAVFISPPMLQGLDKTLHNNELKHFLFVCLFVCSLSVSNFTQNYGTDLHADFHENFITAKDKECPLNFGSNTVPESADTDSGSRPYSPWRTYAVSCYSVFLTVRLRSFTDYHKSTNISYIKSLYSY